MPCCDVVGYQNFGRPCCLNFQGDTTQKTTTGIFIAVKT